MSDDVLDARAVCPPWCTRTHAYLKHGATVIDTQLDDITLTVALAWSEQLGDQPGLGPHAQMELTVGETTVEFDLSPGQARLLARALTADGGAALMADAFTAAADTLDQDVGSRSSGHRISA